MVQEKEVEKEQFMEVEEMAKEQQNEKEAKMLRIKRKMMRKKRK